MSRVRLYWVTKVASVMLGLQCPSFKPLPKGYIAKPTQHDSIVQILRTSLKAWRPDLHIPERPVRMASRNLRLIGVPDIYGCRDRVEALIVEVKAGDKAGKGPYYWKYLIQLALYGLIARDQGYKWVECWLSLPDRDESYSVDDLEKKLREEVFPQPHLVSRGLIYRDLLHAVEVTVNRIEAGEKAPNPHDCPTCGETKCFERSFDEYFRSCLK